MKLNLTKYIALLFAVCLPLISFGQDTSKDKQNLQTKAEQFTQKIITLISQKDYATLNQLTAQKVYCYLCFETAPENNAFVNKKTFYSKHSNHIFNKDLLERLKRKEIKFAIDQDDPAFGDRNYIVLYTTHRPNELDDGHEGAQFIFWLKDEKGILKFSGVETVP